jgi:hypothetical protein
MLRNTSASNGLDSFTIQPKSEVYARTIQRLALLNSRECDFRLAPASRWLLEWGGFPCNAHSSMPCVRRSPVSPSQIDWNGRADQFVLHENCFMPLTTH